MFLFFYASSACWGKIRTEQPCGVLRPAGAVSLGSAVVGPQGWDRAGGDRAEPRCPGTGAAGINHSYKAPAAPQTQTRHRQNSAAASRAWGRAG